MPDCENIADYKKIWHLFTKYPSTPTSYILLFVSKEVTLPTISKGLKSLLCHLIYLCSVSNAAREHKGWEKTFYHSELLTGPEYCIRHLRKLLAKTCLLWEMADLICEEKQAFSCQKGCYHQEIKHILGKDFWGYVK